MPEAKVADPDDWKCRFCCRLLASGATWADMTPGVGFGAGGPAAWSTQVRDAEKDVVS